MTGYQYITDIWKLGRKGHENYQFVDVAVNDDNRLFIDPCLVENERGEWSIKATKYIKSYFDTLFLAYSNCDRENMKYLLSHAGEQNATRLGYGNGDNGKGNTANGLLKIFYPLEKLIYEIKTIGKPQDLPLLIPEFAEDGMSDLLTNILHECLNEFTLDQMDKYGIHSNGNVEFYTWDLGSRAWKLVQRPAYLIGGKELLLVPKYIVRKKYLFSINQYFSRIILERMIDEGGYRDAEGKAIPKKEIIKSKGYSSKHWKYDESIQYTVQNNDALREYHDKLPGFYMEHGKPMLDEELDEVIYSPRNIKIT